MSNHQARFIQLKLNQILRYDSDEVVLFSGYYEKIENINLKKIFSILHTQFNNLFSFMNEKIQVNRHYNADPSRSLKDLIQFTISFHANLKDEYAFNINDYYEDIMKSCNSFLSTNGGSTIPEDFDLINIIEDQPIFNIANTKSLSSTVSSTSVQMRLIGEGSYATVFKYKDPFYNSYYAVKRAKNELRSDELERFRNEFNDLNSLSSPFIIKAFSYDNKKNEYVMEYADETLSKYVNRSNNSLLFENRRVLIEQLFRAFMYIHTKGILHRDISLTNILVKHYDDGSTYAKISDFGNVKRLNSTLTRQGTEIKGVLNDYTDLEVIGFENYEIRHETYALGKVIYFILTGRTSNYHLEKNEALKQFILKAISSDKNSRFASVTNMKEELYSKVYPMLRK
ncbi:protein kinase domain-containing protein [Paenibacillus sp. FSL M7-0420]|uniref:protein kinase domain-containing protein n=1 Tax=Paenibacillus sp. FSL M7-0420 TaxID=2921609 RepID=UPI0030F75F68